MDLALGRARDMPPLQGLGFIGPFSQGVALGYHIMPLWGGSPGPDGAENRCPVGADDQCVEVICLQPQRGVR
jgi:hypothetical protein